MAFLSLENGQVLHATGIPAASPQIKFRVELSDDSTFSLFRRGIFGENKAFTVSLGMMAVRTWTDTVQSGGGFFGGGFGLVGAAEGLLAAAVLNALTTKRREYALLGIIICPLDGSKRELVIGFADIKESELQHRLAKALPAWTESHVQMWLGILRSHKITEQDARASYAQLAKAAELDLLSREQIERMWAALSKVRPPSISSPYSNSIGSGDDRLAKLKALSELRTNGTLTPEEFDAEITPAWSATVGMLERDSAQILAGNPRPW